MTEVLRNGKRALTYVVVAATIAWSVGLAALVSPLTAQAAALTNGTLIKRSDLTTVYYYMNGGRYTFPNEKTFKSWYKDFSKVTMVTADELAAIPLVDNVVVRPGTYLVKITTDPKVYAVEPGGVLRWVKTEDVAKGLWGNMWASWVIDVADGFFTNYTIGNDLATAVYPTGALVKDGSSWFYIENGKKRMVNDAAVSGNNFNTAFAATATLASYAAGTDLGATEVSDTAQTGQQVTPGPTPGAGSLTISMNASSPTGGSVVVDTTSGATLGQRFAKMLAVDFKAMGGEAVVTKVTATRLGISKDGDVDEVYLMDGDMILAKSGSITKGKITWSNTSGLFTVAAGSTKTIWVKADINKSAGSGTTIGFSLDGAELKNGGSVTGSAMGSTLTVATITDLGYLEIATSSPTAAITIDAKAETERELAKFKFDAVDQDLLVKSVTFTQIGTVGASDIKDLKLTVAGTQYGATIADLGSNTLKFDLTGHADGGLKITAGQSKFLDIRGKVPGGTNRNFKFSVQNSEDISVWDTQYNVFAPVVSDNTTTFTVETTAQTTINTGTLTIQVSPDSPKGNIPDGATNVLLAEFDVTASGEEVKVTSLSVAFTGTGSNEIVKNTKLLLAGTQVGTTVASSTAVGTGGTTVDADFTFSNNFTVAAGETKKLKVIIDTTGDNIASADTLRATLQSGTSNAQGKISLTNLSSASVAGYTLTVASGAPTLAENLSVADGSSSNPTGVLNSKNAIISSFLLKAGDGESSKITNITMKTDGLNLAGVFVNLRLQHNGVDIAPVKGTLSSGTTDTFDYTLSEALTLGKSEQYVVDVVADVKSSTSSNPNSDTDGIIYPSSVTYTTLETGQSGTATMSAGLQNVFITESGDLTAAVGADAPSEFYLTMGSTNQEVGRYKLTAGKAEAITITDFVVSFVANNVATAVTGVVKNVRIMDGDKMVGQSVASLSTASATGVASSTAYAAFSNLTFEVPKNSSKTLKVLVDLPTQPDSFSSSTFYTSIMTDYTSTGSDGVVARGTSSGTSLSSITGLNNTGLKGNLMHPVKANLSVAHASDAPSGATSKGDDKISAKWIFTNAANANAQAITLKLLNINIDTSISAAAAHSARELKIYKDSISTSNQLASTSYVSSYSSGDLGGSNDGTGFADSDFTNLTIESGESKTVIITLDTDDASSNQTLTLGLASTHVNGGGTQRNSIQWHEGMTNIFDLKPTATGVGGLPFQGKTLTF